MDRPNSAHHRRASTKQHLNREATARYRTLERKGAEKMAFWNPRQKRARQKRTMRCRFWIKKQVGICSSPVCGIIISLSDPSIHEASSESWEAGVDEDDTGVAYDDKMQEDMTSRRQRTLRGILVLSNPYTLVFPHQKLPLMIGSAEITVLQQPFHRI